MAALLFCLPDVVSFPIVRNWRAEWTSFDAFRRGIDSERIALSLVNQLG